MKIITNKRGYIKQSIEGNLDFMDDDKIRLRDVKIVNLESNFEFIVNVLDVEKDIIEEVI